MPVGKVKWFDDKKGYGFIAPEGGGKDVFVHITAVQARGWSGLEEGQELSFELETNKRSGKQAAIELDDLR